MPAGVQLRDLISRVRAETGKSLNVALGVAEHDTLASQIQQKQEYLYYEYDFPALLQHYPLQLVVAQTIYSFPVGLAFDFINDVWCGTSGQSSDYTELEYGIGPSQYNCSALNNQGWPVARWQ